MLETCKNLTAIGYNWEHHNIGEHFQSSTSNKSVLLSQGGTQEQDPQRQELPEDKDAAKCTCVPSGCVVPEETRRGS
ncbi:zinc finger protein 120-like [Meriones unguiculatus]|uniref:zinc finger protein 120-like n=1 Tax=Meriones unguiculatus TaxID=10047 RepID=UPI00293F2FC7|nr:zinc finger protein 120-like [Meriones unguiculatus]